METTKYQMEQARLNRYASSAEAATAAREAQINGTLRSFRVKYLPATCAGCNRRLDSGMPVVSPERGRLIARCCFQP
jgi:hypothetical protein